MSIIKKNGNSLMKFQMTINYHYKKSNFFINEGQVNKALSSIFH